MYDYVCLVFINIYIYTYIHTYIYIYIFRSYINDVMYIYILLMEKSCTRIKKNVFGHPNWCRIFSINSIYTQARCKENHPCFIPHPTKSLTRCAPLVLCIVSIYGHRNFKSRSKQTRSSRSLRGSKTNQSPCHHMNLGRDHSESWRKRLG